MSQLIKKRVLALSVHSQNFGFAVFDGPHELIDWGIRSFRGGVNAVKIPMEEKLKSLFGLYRPDMLIVNEPRVQKGKRIASAVTQLAQKERISVTSVSRKAVQKSFPSDSESKYHVATAIAARYPELLPRLPS